MYLIKNHKSLYNLDFDFPKCPISMMDTRNMSKKEKDKLKKQQEKLDHALAMLQIEQYHFFHLIKEGPNQAKNLYMNFEIILNT